MRDTQVRFYWQEGNFQNRFRTGVSLHSHTLHSRESLEFIDRAVEKVPWLSGAVRKQRERYRAIKGREVDWSRAWWTPPLSALQAWKVEKSQIEDTLGCEALVSLTDHDNIEAGMQLSVMDETRDCAMSVEWTVPYRRTFFHIGVHNLPAADTGGVMRVLAAVTANPKEYEIERILEWIASRHQAMNVFNHPLWDEKRIGMKLHLDCVYAFFRRFGSFLHALELNGLRPWSENQAVAQLAKKLNRPLISGGDRHGKEPNACVNLTNAKTFSEFVEEIRQDGWSDVLFLPQYRESFQLRILQNLCDIVEPHENHSLGWKEWSDRVFYRTDEGDVKSVKVLWEHKFPSVVRRFVDLTRLGRHRQLRSALRYAFMERREFAL